MNLSPQDSPLWKFPSLIGIREHVMNDSHAPKNASSRISNENDVGFSQQELECMAEENGYCARKPRDLMKIIFLIIAVSMAVFHIFFLGYSSLEPWRLYMAHICFGLVLAFFLYPFSARSNRNRPSLIDILCIGISLISCIYFIIVMDDVVFRVGISPTTADFVFAVCIILLILEITRRTNGPVLPLIALLFLAYALFGHLLPYDMGGHRQFKVSRIASYLVSFEGIMSTPLAASACYVFLLLLFSSFLASIGAGKFFIDIAMALAGSKRGGPAKVAIIGSALFGTISGNSCANVVASGTFTIPLMKKVGYQAKFAGAVEAVSSTGGQMTPPILGAAAFIIAEMVGIPYLEIVEASIIPAALYFLSIFYFVDLEAAKSGLKGLPRESLEKPSKIFLDRGHLILPIFVLMFCIIVLNVSVAMSSIYAIYSSIIVVYMRKSTWISWRELLDGIGDGARQSVGLISACATAGIVIGVLNITGTGLKIAGGIIALAQGILPLALILTMAAAIILGMGLPTAAAYLICAAVIAPALTGLGVEPFVAHMFIFYFACLSAITPPVALAAFTAASLAKAGPVEVALTACRLGLVAFIVPFMFVYEPTLLWRGSFLDILGTLVSAMLGVIALGSSLQGYFAEKPLQMPLRFTFFIAAITLIIPGLITDLIGAGLLLASFLIQRALLAKKVTE